MPLSDNSSRGHHSRLQGNYGEAYLRVMAASTGLRVSKEEPEPEGVDLLIARVLPGEHRARARAEFQVKTTSSASVQDGVIRYSMRRIDYLSLTGTVGIELDIPRYLALVVVPPTMDQWAVTGEDCLTLHRHAYFADLMGPSHLDDAQQSLTVSVPCTNLLTPAALLTLVCGNSEEVA